MSKPIRPASAGPLYATLASQMREAIRSGAYPVGSLLPTEAQLCAEHGLSRHTVREAIRQLTSAGLVTRRAGVGTLVRSRTEVKRQPVAIQSVSELLQFAKGTRQTVLKMRDLRADGALAETLECPPDTPWLGIDVLRFARDDDPICLSQVFIHPDYTGVVRKYSPVGERRPFKQPMFKMIERHYGVAVTHVQQRISAVAVTADVAAALGIRANSPVLQIVRIYRTAKDTVIESSINTFPAHRYSYSNTLVIDHESDGTS